MTLRIHLNMEPVECAQTVRSVRGRELDVAGETVATKLSKDTGERAACQHHVSTAVADKTDRHVRHGEGDG